MDLSKKLANEAIEAATIELQEESEIEEYGPTVEDYEMIDMEEEIDGTPTLFEDFMNEIIQNSSNVLQEDTNIGENPMEEAVIEIASNEGSNHTIEIDNGNCQIIDLSKTLANEAIQAATIELQEELEIEASMAQEQH